MDVVQRCAHERTSCDKPHVGDGRYAPLLQARFYQKFLPYDNFSKPFTLAFAAHDNFSKPFILAFAAAEASWYRYPARRLFHLLVSVDCATA
jgi:hypothetical protein